MTEIAVSHPEFMEGIAAAGGCLTLDREFALLLSCCGDQASGLRLQGCEGEPKQEIDWNKLLRLAGEHRVIPPVYLALAASPGMVPAPCLQALRFRFQTEARQSLLLSSELFRIVDQLASCGIAALAYKGPVLAHLLFDDVTVRQFGDLDLLVRESQVSRATQALAQLGYHPALALTAREERDLLATGYECPFNGPLGRHIVELKWRVLPRFYSIDFAIDAMFERAVTVELEGHSIPTLCSEDLFLVLCVHAAKHAWTQLSLLLDIAGLIRRGGLDWKLIFQQASALGIERLLEVNLLLANQLLGTTLPSRTGPHAPPAPSFRLLEQVRQILAEGEPYNTASLPYFLLMMRLREKWGDRARFLGRLLGTPSAGEWSAIHLPEALFPLYRLVRVFRLLGKLASLARV
jgi:hypothetical protein